MNYEEFLKKIRDMVEDNSPEYREKLENCEFYLGDLDGDVFGSTVTNSFRVTISFYSEVLEDKIKKEEILKARMKEEERKIRQEVFGDNINK